MKWILEAPEIGSFLAHVCIFSPLVPGIPEACEDTWRAKLSDLTCKRGVGTSIDNHWSAPENVLNRTLLASRFQNGSRNLPLDVALSGGNASVLPCAYSC